MNVLPVRTRAWRRVASVAVLGVLVMGAIVLPHVARANPNKPTCWLESDCERLGETATFDTHFDGTDTDCAVGWGYCYPGEYIPLQIRIPTAEGSVAAVADLGTYIGYVYRYGVRVAVMLAVIVIMVGGVLWMTSAGTGNLEKAKTMIMNAVIGLLIAVGSYVILQTINPDLVELSLPRTRIIRTIRVGDFGYCRDAASTSTVLSGSGATQTPVPNPSALPCGGKYALSDGQTCVGHVCDPGSACIPTTTKDFACIPGVYGGVVQAADDTTPRVSLAEVCIVREGPARTVGSTTYRIVVGDLAAVAPADEQGGTYSFMFTSPQVASSCDGGPTRIVGFLLQVNGQYYGKDACTGGTLVPITESTVFSRAAALLSHADFSGGGTSACRIVLPL